MTQLAEGAVQMAGSRLLYVQTLWETARASMYYVTGAKKAGQPFPAEVRVGINSVFACQKCHRVDCIHADAVRKFVASQPVEPLDATGTAGDHVGSTR